MMWRAGPTSDSATCSNVAAVRSTKTPDDGVVDLLTREQRVLAPCYGASTADPAGLLPWCIA